MREQHAESRIRQARRDRDHAIHAGMAARLQHHRAAQMVVPVAGFAALVENCAPVSTDNRR